MSMTMKCSYIDYRSGTTAHEVFDPEAHARYLREGWRHYHRWLADPATRTIITVWARSMYT